MYPAGFCQKTLILRRFNARTRQFSPWPYTIGVSRRNSPDFWVFWGVSKILGVGLFCRPKFSPVFAFCTHKQPGGHFCNVRKSGFAKAQCCFVCLFFGISGIFPNFLQPVETPFSKSRVLMEEKMVFLETFLRPVGTKFKLRIFRISRGITCKMTGGFPEF